MTKGNRNVPPNCIRQIINFIKENGNVSKIIVAENQLVEALYKNAWGREANCRRMVQQCVREGLLVPHPKKPGNLRLPHVDEIVPTHDKYCFECHLPNELIPCKQCMRSFHKCCVRRNPKHSKHKLKLSPAFKKQFPCYDSDSSDENKTNSEPIATRQYNNNTAVHTQAVIKHESISNTAIEVSDESDSETKSGLDVLYIGEVRPPTRKRFSLGTNDSLFWKRELEDDTADANYELCTCCRLIKQSVLRQPPQLDSEELCYLLNFSFKSHRFRLKVDVSNYLMMKKFTASEINVISSMLFVYPERDLKWIENKLANKEYKSVLEFYIDLLDLQHKIGVFYGSDSQEYLAVSYFERFIYYDLSEISRCPDCFRHSNEQHTKFWFAKPCLQRHETVFARIPNSRYWPAKVLNVLRGNRYDVRFFGGKHERALVPESNICITDYNISDKKPTLRPSKLMQAINEMRLYSSLSFDSPCSFSYYGDKSKMEKILLGWSNINNYNNNNVPEFETFSLKRPRLRSLRKNAICSLSLTERSPSTSGPLEVMGTRSRVAKSNSTNVNRNQENNFNNISQTPTNNSFLIEKYSLENQALKKENEKLKRKLKKCMAERKEIKRKQWCPSCLKEIGNKSYYRYCSVTCRERQKKK